MAEESASNELAYYEIGEGRLATAGATLSRRTENGKGVWRLDLPRPDGQLVTFEGPGGPVSPPERIGRLLPAFLRGEQPEPLNGVAPAEEEPAGDAIGLIRAMLGRQYAEILRSDPGVRLDLDPEDVHRLRVAVRRTRAVLRASREVLDPEWSEPLRAELKWLGGSLGPRRDLDVLLQRLREQIARLDQPERSAAASLVETLETERDGAQALATEALASDRYFLLLDALESAARGPRVQRGEASLGRLAAKEFKRLRKTVKRLGSEPTDDELHRVRILGKRARYAAELAEPETGKAARQVVARAKAFQDVLGAHQDAIVAEARLRGLLSDQPRSGAAFAAGRLVERERQRKLEARAELPEAWQALDRDARKAWG